jgi:ABC-type multidrug transport system ATPase subunit
VPVELAGDGTHALVCLALELAIPPQGLALLEEPEVHLHPAGVQLSARAILEAVRRGVQVVLSTHSLELIDALIGQATPDDLARLAVYRTRLRDGRLLTSRFSGAEAADMRLQIEEDLR